METKNRLRPDGTVTKWAGLILMDMIIVVPLSLAEAGMIDFLWVYIAIGAVIGILY